MEKPMPSLNIKKLDTQVYDRLRIQAAEHDVSMEEEARQIISRALSVPNRMSDVFKKHFGQAHGIDLEIPTYR